MKEDTFDFGDFVSVAYKKKWLMVSFSVFCAVAAYLYAEFVLHKTYEAVASVVILPPAGSRLSPQSSAQESDSKLKINIQVLSSDSYLNLARSPSVMSEIIQKLDLKDSGTEGAMRYEHLRDMMSIKIPDKTTKGSSQDGPSSTYLTFTVEGREPAILAQIANTAADVLSEISKEIRLSEISIIYDQTEKELLLAKEQLASRENDLLEARKKLLFSSKLGQLSSLRLVLPLYYTKLTQVTNRIAEDEATDKFLAKNSKRPGEKNMDGSDGDNLNKYIANDNRPLSEATLGDLVQLLRLYLDLNPDEVRLKSKSLGDYYELGESLPARDEDKKIFNEITATGGVSSRNANPAVRELYASLIKNSEELMARLGADLHADLIHVDQLQRSRSEALELYTNLSRQIVDLKALKIGKTSDIRLISKAVEPKVPIGPNIVKIVLIALLGSFFLGIIWACCLEILRRNEDVSASL